MLHYHLRNRGIHIQEGFPCFLTTAHTDADLEFVREAFRSSLRQMQGRSRDWAMERLRCLLGRSVVAVFRISDGSGDRERASLLRPRRSSAISISPSRSAKFSLARSSATRRIAPSMKGTSLRSERAILNEAALVP